MGSPKVQQLNVRIDATKVALLKEIAAEEGTSVNQFLDEQITRIIAERVDALIEAMRGKAERLEREALALRHGVR
jgi:uncharacterized protein (DUF1778 family)